MTDDETGEMFVVYEDAWGCAWHAPRTTDEIRERAWAMIAAADEADELAGRLERDVHLR